MADAIGGGLTPVYVNAQGVPKTCNLKLHDKTTVLVTNKGNYRVIATITVDGGAPIEIKNFKPPVHTVTFKDDVDKSEIAKVIVLTGTDAAPPEAPKHDQYEFDHWEGNYKNVQKDEIVWAKYVNKPWTVKFYQYGAASTPVAEVRVRDGGVPTAPVVTLTGWKFDHWNYDDVPYGNPIYKDTNYYGSWRKEYHNLLLEAVSTQPGESTTKPGPKSVYTFLSLDKSSDLALPVGADVQVEQAYGVLQHDGSSTSHHLLMVPVYMSTVPDSKFSTSNVNDSYTAIIDDRAGSDVTTKISWSFDTSKQPSQLTTAALWDNWWEEYKPYATDGTSKDNWHPYPRLSCMGSSDYVKKNITLSADIDFNKTSGSSGQIRTIDYDTCCHAVTTYSVPEKNPDGAAVDRLAVALIKITSGCTVAWRMHLRILALTLW